LNITLIFLLVTITSILAAQFWFGFSTKSTARSIIQVQAVFWFLAFVYRPIYLLVEQPTSPVYLGDTRLVSLGYPETLIPVLAIVALGQFAFLATLFVFRKLISKPQNMEDSPTHAVNSEVLSAGFAIWAGGTILYLIGSAGYLPNSPIFFLAACSGAGILITFHQKSQTFKSKLVLPFVVVSCALLGVVSASKAPVLAALLALLMRAVSAGAKLGLKKITGYTVATIGTFLILQPLKGINTFSLVSQGSTSILTLLESTQIAILERFDGMIAVIDAYVAGQGSWLSARDYTVRFIEMALPRSFFGLGTTSPGELWALEVRAQSNPIQKGVSLAVGPSADGFLVLGWAGVIMFNIALGLFIVYSCVNFESNQALKVIFFSIWIFGPQFFEQSLLGVASGLSRSAIICFICWLWILLRRSWQYKQ
jgi:hypothetical protein